MTASNEGPNARRTEPFQWLEPAHSMGERLAIRSEALRQALAWQVAAELVRRHPKTLRLSMAYIHQYGPALMPMELRADGHWHALYFLTWGTGAHITPVGRDWSNGRFNWMDVLLAPDRRAYVVQEMERQVGITSPSTTPPSTTSTIGIRFIAAFMAKTALAPRVKWLAVNALIEDDDGTAPAEKLLAAFPAVQADWASRDAEGEWATSRYWFVVPVESPSDDVYEAAPVAAVDFVSGTLWTSDGKRRDLMAEFVKHGRHVDALVSRYLPPTQ